MAAPRRDITLSHELMMALMMKGYQNHFDEYRRLEIERLRSIKSLAVASSEFGLKLSADIVHGQVYVEQAVELRKQIETLAGREFHDISWAVEWLRNEVRSELGKLRYGREAAGLVRIAIKLSEGDTYGVVAALRAVLERLESEVGLP